MSIHFSFRKCSGTSNIRSQTNDEEPLVPNSMVRYAEPTDSRLIEWLRERNFDSGMINEVNFRTFHITPTFINFVLKACFLFVL